MFLDPEASQENLKRPEKAPKRHPKRHPKVVQKLVKKRSTSAPKNEQKQTLGFCKQIAPIAKKKIKNEARRTNKNGQSRYVF